MTHEMSATNARQSSNFICSSNGATFVLMGNSLKMADGPHSVRHVHRVQFQVNSTHFDPQANLWKGNKQRLLAIHDP